MKGLELCKSYYENIGKPELFRIFPEVMGRAAAGLSGQGSDCLGLDDEFSRDHDFGPGFILWLTDADYENSARRSRPPTMSCRSSTWASSAAPRIPAHSASVLCARRTSTAIT